MADDSESARDDAKRAGPRRLGLVGLLVELVLPTALAATLLLVVANHVPIWDLRSPAGLAVFGVLLVAGSVFASFRLDLFTLAGRRSRGKRQIFNRAGAWPRLVKFVLGGVVVPLAALFAANRIELPDHRTPMTVAIEGSLGAPATPRARLIGDAVLRADTPAAKVEGILALQAMDSPESLDQLFRIAGEDTAAMRDAAEYRALVKAVAAAGERARPRLLQLFRAVPLAQRRTAPAPPGTLYERYFAEGFEGARAEVEARSADPAARSEAAERLGPAEDALRRTLESAEGALRPAGSASLPAFVLDALLATRAPQDAEVLAFAREVAADASWSDGVRGQALLLVGKLGGEGDLDAVYGALAGPSPALREAALRAAAELHGRVATTAK